MLKKCSNLSKSFNKCQSTSSLDPIHSTSSPSLTSLLKGKEVTSIFGNIEACLTNDSIPPGIDDADFDSEGDLLLLEKLLNDDPLNLLESKVILREPISVIQIAFIDFLEPKSNYRESTFQPKWFHDIKVKNQINNGNSNGNVGGNNGCTYKGFVACGPRDSDGTSGAVALTRWIEKMESVIDNSGCLANQRVKYAASSFIGKALTWWNTQVQARD
ncbi:hypothetical protein Tco_0256252 [Tanacetum coccineum]